MSSPKVEAGDLSGRPKHRSSCSTVEEVWSMPRQWWLCPLHYRHSPQLRRYQQGTPRSGYRGSDFVHWPQAEVSNPHIGEMRRIAAM